MAYALPLKSIDEHVEESVVVLVQEGDYPAETPGMVEKLRDNYTDALMLNMASYNNRDYSLIRKAFGNYKKRSSDKSVVNWLQRRNEKNCKSISYARYWQGYLVPLKILLEIFNYQQIRSLLIFCDLLLIVWNCLLLQENVLHNAVDTVAFRVSTSNGDNTWTYMDVLKLNVSISPKIVLFLHCCLLYI